MDLNEMIIIALSAMLIQNIVLTKFLGVCPSIDLIAKKNSFIKLLISSIIIILITSIATYLVYTNVLVPNNLTYILTITFVVLISFIILVIEILLKNTLRDFVSSYLPIVTTNCLIFGIALLNIRNGFDFTQMIIFSVSASIGYILIIYIYAYIKQRLDSVEDMPDTLKGLPIAMLVLGMMALGFMGFM